MSTHDEIKDIAFRDHFTVPEWLEREKYISAIRQFDQAHKLAEQALIQIRDKKLYRPYKTLREFCQKTFGWSERRTQQVLAAEKVVAALPDKKRTMVRTERQARELARVPEERRVEVLDAASDNGEVTAKSIRTAATKVTTWPKDKSGIDIPPSALPFWNRRQEVRDILNDISNARSAIRNISDDDKLYHSVRIRNIEGELDSAYNQLKGALPEHVCGYCKGVKSSQCRACKGTGVMSEFLWKNVPKDNPF